MLVSSAIAWTDDAHKIISSPVQELFLQLCSNRRQPSLGSLAFFHRSGGEPCKEQYEDDGKSGLLCEIYTEHTNQLHLCMMWELFCRLPSRAAEFILKNLLLGPMVTLHFCVVLVYSTLGFLGS